MIKVLIKGLHVFSFKKGFSWEWIKYRLEVAKRAASIKKKSYKKFLNLIFQKPKSLCFVLFLFNSNLTFYHCLSQVPLLKYRNLRFYLTPPFILPAIAPAATVDVTGDFLSLMLAKKEKSRPSCAMARMIRGRGNMEPNRLG